MIAGRRAQTKVVPGGFLLALLLVVLSYNGWVISTSLQRFTYLIAGAVVLFVVWLLLLVNDLVAG